MLWWVQVDKLLATLPSEEGEEAVQQAILEALVADNRTAGPYLRFIDFCFAQL